MGNTALKARDKHGLLPQQRLVLQELLTSNSWQTAASRLGLPPKQFGRWMREDPAFRAAYDALFDSDKGETVRKQIAALAGKASDVLEEAMEATKHTEIDANCPECGAKFKISAAGPNWTARLRAAENVTKVGGQLKDSKTLKVEGEIIHMSLEHKLAMFMLKAGRPEDSIPSYILRDLREAKALKDGTDGETIIDAEYWRIITEENTDETDPPDEQPTSSSGLQKGRV